MLMLDDWIDTVATAAHRAGFGWRARREIARLLKAGGHAERRMALALSDALHEAADPAEAAWMDRIEALRAALRASADEVSFEDYGLPARRQAPGPSLRVTRAVRDVCRASVPAHEARVLFHLIRRFRPARCLELGTCLGLSAAYQAAALTLNGAGRLITLEGGAALARRAEHHFDRLGLHTVEVVTGPFQDTLPPVLDAHSPIDYAFIDGHHDPAALQAYVRTLAPHLADEAVLVFDDVAWTTKMRRAWRAVVAPEVCVAVDLLAFGFCCYQRAQ